MNLPDGFEPGPALEEYDKHPCHDGDVPVSAVVTLADAAVEELAEQTASARRIAADWFEKQQEQWKRARRVEAEVARLDDNLRRRGAPPEERRADIAAAARARLSGTGS